FVATAMTQGMKLPPLITASADEVGRAVFLGQQARKDVIYTRSVWRPLMAIIKAIPEPLFKRLSL
ncbi:MAG TPA: short-chain dehydrogenase, partial [Sphingomicrobium sp.]